MVRLLAQAIETTRQEYLHSPAVIAVIGVIAAAATTTTTLVVELEEKK